MIRTIAVVLFLALALLFVMPFFILWSLLTGTPDLMYEVAMKTVRASLRIAKIKVCVEGLETIPPGVCIFAANHTSNVDPLAFIPAIPRRVSILVKTELFRIPILATAMRMAKFVPVDREDKEAAAASVEVAARVLKEGLSLAVYPEGTRSPDGRMQRFKKGSFVMAIEAGVPIVPVACSGAHRIMKKNSLIIHPGTVTVRFGKPVDASSYTVEQRNALAEKVHDAVAAELPDDQKPAS